MGTIRSVPAEKGEGHYPGYLRVSHAQEVTAKADIQWEALGRWLVMSSSTA